MTIALRHTPRAPALSVGPIMWLAGLAFIAVFILQTTRSIYLDANNLDGSRIDLAGYVLNTALGLPLLYYGVQRRLYHLAPLFTLALFLAILALNITSNTSASVISVILSRYGLLTWLLIGLWTATALHVIVSALNNTKNPVIPWICSATVYTALAPVALLVATFLINPPNTISYQSVANNSILLMCVCFLTLHAIVQTRRSGISIMLYALLILSSALVYTVAVMQSTGIVAFWVFALPVILYSVSSRSTAFLRWVMIVALAVALYALAMSFVIGDLFKNTRLASISEGLLTISSIQTRLLLLPDFWPQFDVAPVFGNFNAEMRSGFDEGAYMHSIPLSLLTHTGLIGFLLISLACFFVFRATRASLGFASPNTRFALGLFGVTLLLGTLYAFFTWAPFWFFLGYMSVRGFEGSRQRGAIR